MARLTLGWSSRRPLAALALLLLLPWTPAGASELRNTPVVKAVEQVAPSVVNIHGKKTVRSATESYVGDQFKTVNGMGTGVIIDERGYVITNYHVVEGVRRIQVSTVDDTTYIATLVANDPTTDLAVIKIESDRPFPVVRIGTSSDLMLGEPVIAVGNAFGYSHTITRGIISSLHRSVQVSDDQKYEDLIQTDASINPGNSGGPLLNIDGEVIGVNVAVRVGAQGIGFAIPINEALQVAARLMSVERLERKSHGAVGVDESTATVRRFTIREVQAGSSAAEIGLVPGDVITSAGGVPVQRALDFERALLGRGDEEVPLIVSRDGQSLTLKMILKPYSSPAAPADQHWQLLGLRLETLSAEEVRRYNARYRGGLKVTAVRADGPAARQGIRRGDILVGMHLWETISLDNVDYILSRSDFASIQPLKFYIVRGSETLFGHMSVSASRR